MEIYVMSEPELVKREKFLFEFDERIRSFGWHRIEQHWSGKPYRWSGPHIEAIVVLEVPRSIAYSLTIDLVGIMDPTSVQAIKVFADGRALKTHVLRNGADWQILLEVPARESARRDELELAFKVIATLQPSVINNEPDDRLLGIAVSRFQLEPIEGQ